MSENIRYSVVICTWNRADDLKRVLKDLENAAQHTNESWQLCIVDNNSSDHTQSVVNEYAATLPIKYIFEAKQGLSIARNTGLSEAEGQWIIFTDDDVEIPNLWLRNYFSQIDSLSQKVAFVGGEVEPKFLGQPNQSMLDAIPIIAAGYCGITLPETREINKSHVNIPFGANFALNKSKIGETKFDGNLGVSGKTRLAGEESIFMRELIHKGEEGMWLEDIKLTHLVPAERLTDDYVKNYLIGKGRTSVLLAEDKSTVVKPWMFRQIVELFFKRYWLIFTFRYSDYEKYKIMMVLYQRLGFIYQKLMVKR